MSFKLIVIGGGPGGYVSAIQAARYGAKVTLIEKDRLGGTCLQRGCIPTKALYRNAQFLKNVSEREKFGVSFDNISFDLAKAKARKDKIVSDLEAGIGHLLKSHKIEYINAHAAFVDPKTLGITDSEGTFTERPFDRVLIASGSKVSRLPIPGNELSDTMSSNETLDLEQTPNSMVIIGGGVIGIEFAGIFAAFGTEVTVLEFLPQILNGFDSETVRRFAALLKKQGIKVETGVKVEEIIESPGNGLCIKSKGKEYFAEKVLFATGRRASVEGLGLEKAGIRFEPGGIIVDENYRTSNENVYAIGDVIGGKMLAHLASAQGTACIEAICGSEPRPVRAIGPVPSCVFSFPELAAVGSSEDELKANSVPYKSVKTMFRANGKALTMQESDGFVKLLFDPESKKILGVHILGPHADDLIQEVTLAMTNDLGLHEIARTVHAHPGLSEALHDTVCAALEG